MADCCRCAQNKQIELPACRTKGEGWVAEYYCWGLESKGHSLYGDEWEMKVAPRPSWMIHRLPWPLIPGFTSILLALPQGDFKYKQYTAQWTRCSCRLLCFCTRRMCVIIRACVCFGACRLRKHVCQCQMSEVHCSTLLTSNVTNNFFLQLHCSNPFSGFWNGNIITFLWCGAFDKTASRCAECLTELDVSPKPLSLYSTLLLCLIHSAASLSSPFSSHPQSFSLAPPKSHSASLSFSPAQVLQWIKEVLSTLSMARPFRRLMRGVCSLLWLAPMDWCRRSRWAVMRAWISAR